MGEAGRETRGGTAAAGASSDGFAEFAKRHYEPLAKALALMTLDRQLAADAAQDAFLQLQLRWDTVDELDDPVAWLFRVAINRCHDYHRQLTRASRLVERLVTRFGSDDADYPWAPETEFASLTRTLPKQQRIAAVLFYQADLSIAEIARIMGISEGAVNSHLARARKALRSLVGEAR